MIQPRSERPIMREIMAAVVRNCVYPIWAKRDHPYYSAYFREFQRSQFLSQQKIRNLQVQRLRNLVEHAYNNCSFYKARMDHAGLAPSQVKSVDDLKKLPILTKRDIQDHSSAMMARNIPECSRVRNQTGGSTGSPLQFYVDKERFDSRMASTNRHNLWAGLRPGDWYGYLWGARLDQVIHPGFKDWLRNTLLYRRIELNTSHIMADGCRVLVQQLRRKRPRFLIAYAKSAVLFANYVREDGIDDLHFDSMITTAEVLMPEDRRLLEEVFGGAVFNRYGCRELSVIASECECHRMHVNADALFLEIVPERGLPVGAGKVVVTDLLNRSMPLIRYETGDVAQWSDEHECPCGRGLPILQDVQGRTTDFLILRDGRRISGPALTLVVADMPDVRQVQFIQHGVEEILLKVVPGKGYDETTRAELRKRLSLYLSDLADLRLEETTHIASEVSGKYRFVISDIPPIARSAKSS